MFDIEYKGGSTVVVKTKNVTVITDPKLSLLGLKDAAVNDCVVISTEHRFMTDDVADARLLIDSPGEFEIGKFSIKGVAMQRHIDEGDEKNTTSYRIEVEDIAIGFLGHVDAKPTEEQLESLGLIDILIVPVGGNGYTLDAQSAVKLAKQIEPKIVVPVHYDDTSLKYEVPQAKLDEFTAAMNLSIETVSKLKIKSSASLPESMTVYVIERS
ncbi:MBL fold metallo-hydrolase [Candidatus Saccharibacteria bacterium]|nr:MBL fold metallo-hydrolase [Candidatus Saccharibacteria bacterium]